MKPDFGIFLAERKVVQFFADKVVLFLSLLILSFIVIDSFISVLPYGKGTVQCFIESNNVASGQQSYIDAYCAEYVPRGTYLVPINIFIHGLITVLLHYAWYSTVLYANRFVKAKQAANQGEGGRRPIWLLICYVMKNVLQAVLAGYAVVCSFCYEFNESSILHKTFPCPIKGQGNIDYWTDLDTVQCFYNSVALNDVFLTFYGIMSICVILAAFFGLVDIFVRPDLKNKCILKPSSSSSSSSSCCCCCELAENNDILKYCLPNTKERTITNPA